MKEYMLDKRHLSIYLHYWKTISRSQYGQFLLNHIEFCCAGGPTQPTVFSGSKTLRTPPLTRSLK